MGDRGIVGGVYLSCIVVAGVGFIDVRPPKVSGVGLFGLEPFALVVGKALGKRDSLPS